MSGIIKVEASVISQRSRLITLAETLITLDITKTIQLLFYYTLLYSWRFPATARPFIG